MKAQAQVQAQAQAPALVKAQAAPALAQRGVWGGAVYAGGSSFCRITPGLYDNAPMATWESQYAENFGIQPCRSEATEHSRDRRSLAENLTRQV